MRHCTGSFAAVEDAETANKDAALTAHKVAGVECFFLSVMYIMKHFE